MIGLSWRTQGEVRSRRLSRAFLAIDGGHLYSLTICRNGACSSGTFDASSACQLKGELKTTFCSLKRSPQGAGLTLSFVLSSPNPKDGDEYTVKLVNGDTGAAPVDVKTTVTYKTSQPNGSDCDPGCKTAAL